MKSTVKIAPSLLAADFLHLEKDVKVVNKCADILHLDIMDGILVPNISYGFPVVEAIAGIVEKPLDAHLMIVHPENYFERFAAVGVNMLSFHLEAADRDGLDVKSHLARIRALGMQPGLAINPDIPVERVLPYAHDVDYFVIMSVFAGFGGQKFIEDTYAKIVELKRHLVEMGSKALIEVDGGVNVSNAPRLAECGADILVAGSAVFKSIDPVATVRSLKGE